MTAANEMPFHGPMIIIITKHEQEEKKLALTSSAEVHRMTDGVVAVDAERHQDVRR
jgi:hypothetical protein